MFNVCPNCGEYRADKKVLNKAEGTFAECPVCTHQHHFLQLPLFIVTGPSGVGKSSVALELAALTNEFVTLESDILWDERFNQPETNYRDYRETWLRMSKNISQNGNPVVLCGTAMPDQIESCLERRYFSTIYYIALICNNETLENRLRERPEWRGSGNDDFINGMKHFNDWLRFNGPSNEPSIYLIDTTVDTKRETAEKITSFIKQKTGQKQL